MIPRSTKSRVGPLDPEDPSLSWSEELPPITAEGKSLSSRGVFLPPLKLALTPITVRLLAS